MTDRERKGRVEAHAEPAQPSADSEFEVFTVDELLSRLGLTAMKTVLERVPRKIRVMATVSKVRAFQDKLAYLTLSGSELSVSGRCPLDMAPVEGSSIVFEGQPILKPHRMQTGLEIQVVGRPVGEWTPTIEPTTAPPLEPDKRVLLRAFLDRYALTKLLVAGTRTAIKDVRSVLDSHGTRSQPTFEIIRVVRKRPFLSDVQRAVKKHRPRGLAIVRGGDDESLRVFDDAEVVSELRELDLPIYTALGHSHRVTFADKAADEAFLTPSQLGSTIDYVMGEIGIAKWHREKLKELRIDLETARFQLDRTRTRGRLALGVSAAAAVLLLLLLIVRW